ncbi:Saccharopine dehydrogenase-domain-containing protein [Fimicolochytrium jonesii]|uniref:Saccharopine dehydrogenase-domain-containing protein n=1 Tax=Fimicolochytrium jonesii TaxID=1396493 RepID=UPI0022FEF531|nr:Saccharopine dehydrogenase-domain-containing protein [Fimicolochytrium jonesii]KAI8820791.1 Saccharopine dehydrogenase-domain-containing protein [Fimicolochytrium jonesii]
MLAFRSQSHARLRHPQCLHQCQRKFSKTAMVAASATSTSARLSIGIRAEQKNRWERRVPLMPEHVERLVKETGTKVYVQPSTKRVVPDEKYRQAGAIIAEDLSVADVIVGVKEVPIEQLIADKTYLFFSHTHKGQKYNMPLLQAVLDKRIRLIDYELMTDDTKRRVVQFSRFAGYAGMIDSMHGLGHRLLALGYGNPFLAIGMSYMYRTLADARLDVTRTGQVIMDDGLPRQMGPMSFVFTGDGHVARGAMHVFKCLPHEWVSPDELRDLYKTQSWSHHRVYACQVTASDYLVRKDGWKFNRDHYREHPEHYMSIFHEKIAPYTNVLVNGIFWDEKYPRLLTSEQATQLANEHRLRMLSIADVSCDINGSLEFMSHSSTIDSPFYMYDPATRTTHDNMEGAGIQIMSIDNLPTELPLEASEYFSNALFPYVNQLAMGNVDHPVLKRATIATADGKLAPARSNLQPILNEYGKGAKVTASQNVLLLGSGFVAAPLVDYLLRAPHRSVTIASNSAEEATRLANGRANAPVTGLNVADKEALAGLVAKHDVVVSFVPATLHPTVAEACINEGKNMVTASYISPAMQALNDRVKRANLTILNEVGLDPGIDHLTAMQLFDEVKEKGGKITSFVSWCGGLPAPEASNNPLGYKFSWSPKGVLLAGLNSAHFKRDGEIIQVPGSQLFESRTTASIAKGFALEGIPNRDSLKYVDLYNLGDISDLDTMFRGTLRYTGYCDLMATFRDIGLFNDVERTDLKSGVSWADLTNELLGIDAGSDVRTAIANVLASKGKSPSEAHLDTVVSALQWLEMLSPHTPLHPSSTILDAFCAHLQKRLVYAPTERDMVAMHHEFGIKWRDGSREKRTSTLFAYGEVGGYTAMAKTVGLPAAIGAEMLLDGQLRGKGVIAPMTKEIYEPMLRKLENENIRFVEQTFRL